jgi:predicted O-methyltransferase YrrM
METMTAWNRNIPFFEHEIAPLCKSPISILEVGSYQGMSTRWMLEHLQPQDMTCIDLWRETAQHESADFKSVEAQFDRNIEPYQHKVTKLKGDSWSQLLHLNQIKRQFDLIYIDGDHSAQGVLRDLVLSWPLLLKGGVMICDDYVWKENLEAWRLGFRDFHSPLETPKMAIDAFTLIYSDQMRHWMSYYQYGTVAFMKISD